MTDLRQYRLCPVCDGLERRIVYRQRFLDGPLGDGYDVAVCVRCGAGFADGIASQTEMDRYYAEQSKYAYGQASGSESSWDFKRFEATADQLMPHLRSPDARILDIGCATGGLLSVLKGRGFPNVIGADPSTECAEAAERLHGVKVRAANLRQLRYWDDRFDVILMVGVLEHLHEAKEAVRGASHLLNPEGLLYCAVPDVELLSGCRNAPYQQFSVEHVNFFSSYSLRRLMAECGMLAIDSWSWKVEWREGVWEPIASGMFKLGSETHLGFDSHTELALARYLASSEDGDRRILETIESLRLSQEPILVWGAGTLARRLLATTSFADANIVAFVDSNSHLQIQRLANRPIIEPKQVASRRESILICSAASETEIVEMIRKEHGFRNPILSIFGDGRH